MSIIDIDFSRGVDRIGPTRSDPRSGQNVDRIGFHNSADPIRDPDRGSAKIGAIRSFDPASGFRFWFATACGNDLCLNVAARYLCHVGTLCETSFFTKMK
jgi:hypothetical protein